MKLYLIKMHIIITIFREDYVRVAIKYTIDMPGMC